MWALGAFRLESSARFQPFGAQGFQILEGFEVFEVEVIFVWGGGALGELGGLG